MSMRDQLLGVGAWLRSRYETAPAVELPMLAAVIGYLETLAESEPGPGTGDPGAGADLTTEDGPEPSRAVAEVAEAAGAPAAEVIGTFKETASGGTVTPDGGGPIPLPWRVVHAAGLVHGDRVRLVPKPEEPERFLYTRTGASVPIGDSGVREAVVALKDRDGTLACELDGRTVRVVPGWDRLRDLVAGDVATVRYDPSELGARGARAYAIRGHLVGETEKGPSPPTRDVRQNGRHVRRRRGASAATGTAPEIVSPVDALAGDEGRSTIPRILIVGGHDRNFQYYRRALLGAAKVEWEQGSRLSRSLRARVSNAGGVVVVVQYMSHAVSDYVQGEVKRRGTPYILTQSENVTGLVRQVREDLLPRLAPGRGAAPTSAPELPRVAWSMRE